MPRNASARSFCAVLAACAAASAILAVLAVPSPARSATTSTFAPTDDARVDASFPTTNFGGSKALLIDTDPNLRESFLRFDVSGISGTVERATLRLFAYDGSADGPAVYRAETSWSESEITWETRPARTGDPFDDAGAVTDEAWTTLDVTAAITGNGVHAFALVPTSGDGADFYSSEGVFEGGPPPELVVTVADEPTPPPAEPTPPSVVLTNPPSGSSYTEPGTVDVTASASDDDGVARVEFYDGDALRGTDTSEPFSHAWSLSTAENGSHSWTAKAYDTAGDSAVSAPVDVTVAIPEPSPEPSPPEAPVTAALETTPVPNGGDAADDPAVWVHPVDPSLSTIIATDKQGGLAVYDLSGKELHYYAGGRPNSVDLLEDFLLGGLRTTIVAVSDRASDTIGVYAIDPVTRGLTNVAVGALSLDLDVYGLCSYRSELTGKHFVFVGDKLGTVEQWELFDVGIGKVGATKVRTFAVGSTTEGCVADDERGDLYVGEEDVGIWRYGAEPDAGSTRTPVDTTGAGGQLTADVEGLTIFAEADGGYLLASSQGSDDFTVYDRADGDAYVGRFRIEAGAVDAVSDTDGIDVASVPLGAAFPEGVFVAQDGTNDDGNQNFKLVPWERIAGALEPDAETPGDGESGACTRPYSISSPWNTPVGASPAYHPQSEFHVTALEGVLTSDPTQYTYPVYEVSASTLPVPVALSGWFSNVIDESTLENQRGGFAYLPIPAEAVPAAGSDAQMILVDPATGDEWGVSNLERDSLGNWTAWNAYHYNTQWSGVPPRDASGRPFFLRGAGVPYLAGLVRPCEIERGRIDHALAFAYDFPTGEYVYPATKSDGVGTDPADMPEGTRLQLDPSVSEAEIRGWGCTGPCLTIAQALQEYGMYVIDNSGREKVMLEYEGTAGWNGVVDAETVNPIPLAAFKVVLPPDPASP